MARIKVLTFHNTTNYGAVLQAYGLAKAIANMGHDVEILDYRPLPTRLMYEGNWPRNPLKFLRLYRYRRRFSRFRKSYLPLSRTYLSIEELEQAPPHADYVVCGSDQVWNVSSYRGFDPAFFLSFPGEATAVRISYAATFGNAELEDLGSNREAIRSLLSRFEHISVRDAKSANMVDDLIHRPAVHVLDPSFLADYGPITPRRVIRTPYILLYCYLKNELSMHAVRYLHRELRMPVVSIRKDFDQAEVVYPGPLQWLSLMHHASFVCTDSFHGTCFSIINRKQFATLPFESGMSRIEDVLRTAGLSDRLIRDKGELEVALHEPIDYEAVSLKIEEARNGSLAFLRNALK